jgi:hypothetical protein
MNYARNRLTGTLTFFEGDLPEDVLAQPKNYAIYALSAKHSGLPVYRIGEDSNAREVRLFASGRAETPGGQPLN